MTSAAKRILTCYIPLYGSYYDKYSYISQQYMLYNMEASISLPLSESIALSYHNKSINVKKQSITRPRSQLSHQ